jgi:hypothetical protein
MRALKINKIYIWGKGMWWEQGCRMGECIQKNYIIEVSIKAFISSKYSGIR